jgi:DNA-binding NarL/FixJ family response regulator
MSRSRSKQVYGVMAAMVLGTTLSAKDVKAAAPAAPTPDTAIQEMSRYCQACWRNARLPADRWSDCTQQVLERMLERVEVNRWNGLLRSEGEEKVEFLRAIDTVKKRTQRDRRHNELANDFADRRGKSESSRREQWDAVNTAAKSVLSDRQLRIVELSASGWPVPEIAKELQTTPERVSDEKYKAIQKLRMELTEV